MELDSVFWLTSGTKLVTAIACMQLVEKGVLRLDDVELVEKLSPELEAVQVLQDDGTLVPKERGITIRMLLTHTAGFGYSFSNKKLLESYGACGLDEFTGSYHEILSQPLLQQPALPFLAATMIQGLVVLNHETYEMKRWQSTLVYWALVGLSTAINIWGRRLLSVVEGVSLLVHICAFIAITAVLWACSPTKHSAKFVFTSFVNNSGWSSNGVAWSIGLLSSCYVLAIGYLPVI
ncbi:hypothetical protein ASPCADRAFT_125721 [Aspergillus carbonarius ITEM 5010]|uniref:Beta-lactamase-related domain-containing protein n=1 Tax=Aspergillus carbonarius (strain ITEM 5010) TaxID=602072 RepID=A0A1R3S1Y0_ASPC5|nr:hypothetical protein ASPCADRAFT_125721 [Aspergillus carbonarius ITEM 5010]